MSVAGKVAFVSGASRGIGHFMAREFARAGAHVVVAARTEDESLKPGLSGSIHSVAAELRGLGAQVLPIRMDVTRDEDIERAVQLALAEFGRIDVLVNNAAVEALGHFKDHPLRRSDLVLRVNLRGPVAVTSFVLPGMVAQRSGTIICNSSWGAEYPGANFLTYAVSKAGIEKFVQGLAVELADQGICAFALKPNRLVETPGFIFTRKGVPPPAERTEPPELMGRAAILLCSDAARPLSGRTLRDTEVLHELAGEPLPDGWRGGP